MLEQYFSDAKIIDQLCKERVKLAGSIHDRKYTSRLTGRVTEIAPNHPFYRLLPSRRTWSTFRPRNRTSGSNPDLIALKKAVEILLYQEPHQPWAEQLRRYVATIQARVLGNETVTFAPPTINWERKKNKRNEYRALCRFDPSDNLILCLFSQYLRDSFDSQFSSSSYAFRARNSQGLMPTHHQAFDAIYDLKHSAPERELYVAECDIRGFYDSVDHGVALAAFHRAAENANLHPKAEVIFRAYLNCYSFPSNVLAEAGPRLKLQDSDGYFPWPTEELLKIHRENPHNLRIGVAQGGAVSGIIANLILDDADKCVEQQRDGMGAQIHYYRFCDDMVLISPVKKHCQVAFEAYLRTLDELRLPYHKPKRTIIYGAKHWRHKSKAPYCWSGRQWFGCVPWVQFAGYQVRYDGLVRPRKESIAKEALKLVQTTGRLKTSLLAASREIPILATRNQAMASLKAKLVAQGVGRIKGSEPTGPKSMCWASGFKAIDQKPFISSALRLLDCTRQRQIGRFAAAQIGYGRGRNGQSGRQRDPVGYAFSYHGQFRNEGGRQLIENSWRPRNIKEKLQSCAFKLFTILLTWYKLLLLSNKI